MSSDDSRTTSSSRLSQFGLYRTIDARTEEFLRLSRKRQIRQGCACAAVSTAITVTVVVVILLIYEYAIAVESSLVQKIRMNKMTNETQDKPFADRLDRSYFGFDQDYFERMPLLVNAMQENSYTDQLMDTTTVKQRARYLIANITKPTTTTHRYRPNSIRRTSPRPFYFEYKSPTPTPFSKTYGSRSWVDSYRNAQRLKNLQQVIQYLEKTINAKFGDMYALPTSTIAFSGVFLEPDVKQEKEKSTTPTYPPIDLIASSSRKFEAVKSNHQPDPLYNYKPDSPGDVNLLADGFFRFSPIPTPSVLRDTASSNIPMFRPITHRKRSCIGIKCIESVQSKYINSQESSEIKSVVATSHDKPKSFSVMLNLYPLKPTSADYKSAEVTESTQPTINKISITTRRPVAQFRRRSTTPIRRKTVIFKRPLYRPMRRQYKTIDFKPEEKRDVEPKMIVHVNVFPSVDLKDQVNAEQSSSTTQTSPPRYSTEIPMLTSTQVEDYHVGSSGVIPVEARLTPAPPPPIPAIIPTLPSVTNMIPFFDTTATSTESNFRVTNPTEILKFSHEDAKVPDQYKKLMGLKEMNDTQPEINRRNSHENIENTETFDEDCDVEPKLLISKLKNAAVTTSTENSSNDSNEETDETTTVRTYVPQINGHYRSVNQNSRNINSWLNDNSENNRKRRLEMSVAGFRKTTYVPYVEIKRNYTRNSSDVDKEN